MVSIVKLQPSMPSGSTSPLSQACLGKILLATPAQEAIRTRIVDNDNASKPDLDAYFNHDRDSSIILKTEHKVCSTDKRSSSTLESKELPISSQNCDPHIRNGWKPVTLRSPVLFCSILFSFSLVTILEILFHYSTGDDNGNGGGLAFAADVESLPATASFFYLYFPTVVAVVYSMLWSWVDLDAKRLEPWFQLSKPEGSLAKDSLLLHYPFEFLAFVPISALRKRHWSVFYAGLTAMIIFWAITPLQSAIFTTGTVDRTKRSQYTTSGSIIPPQNQPTALSVNFLNTAFGVTWLDQRLPAYTTQDYALLPYMPLNWDPNTLLPETWSTSALAYSTEINCKAADFSLDNSTGYYSFDSGDGCVVPQIILPDAGMFGSKLMVLYIQYWNDAETDWSLEGESCGKDHSHKFLAISANSSAHIGYGKYTSLTALFCEPRYYVQRVTADVNSTDKSIVNSTFVSNSSTEGVNLLSDNSFNITHFEYIIGTGISPAPVRRDYQDTIVLEQYQRVAGYGLTWPISNMVGFAVATKKENSSDLVSPLALQEAFSKAHKLTFAMAISTLTSYSYGNSPNDLRDGLIHDQPAAIIFVRPFAIAVETGLLVSGLLTFALWYHSHRRPSSLKSDPASISDVMSLVRNSKEVSYFFKDDGTTTERVLQRRLSQHRFSLRHSKYNSELSLHLLPRQPNTIQCQEDVEGDQSSHQKELVSFRPVRPLEMRLPVGLVWISLILGATCLLPALYVRVTQIDGLPRFTTNSILLVFVESTIPTAFASVLEPMWVVLNRLLCVLQPFENLRIGHAKSSATIHVKYTSLPPQLVAMRAFKARNYTLAIICAIAISSNVLAVTLGALFGEAPTLVQIDIPVHPLLSASFNGSVDISDANTQRPIPYADHFHVTISNITDGTPLPPWIDEKFFYIPFEIPNTPPQYVLSSQGNPVVIDYTAKTRGFGIVASCQSNQQNSSARNVLFDLGNSGLALNMSLAEAPENPTLTSNDVIKLAPGSLSNDPVALEIARSMNFDRFLVLGWLRVGSSVPNGTQTPQNVGNGTSGRSFAHSAITCLPQLVTAEFEITVDSTGRILASNQLSPLDEKTEEYSTANSTAALLSQVNQLLGSSPVVGYKWHNDSFTSDWMNAVFKVHQNSTDIVDPTKPVPSESVMIPIVEATYQRLAAVILGLSTGVFFPPSTTDTTEATVSLIETRIFMSPLMFQLSTAILTFHLFAAVLYYALRPEKILPRMPTTIASLIAYVSMSHAVDDVSEQDSSNSGQQSGRYAYGRFIGVDGKAHVGIERLSRVIPLQIRTPQFRACRRNLKVWLKEMKEKHDWI